MEERKHYSGLTDSEVTERVNTYGKNILTPPKREPLWKQFLQKFEDPIIRILLMAAFLSLGIAFIDNEFAETIGIFFAIFLATGVAFWFEADAAKKFDVLNQVNDDMPVKVIRNNNICEIPKKDIVPGDVILLETGDEIPADGILLESVSLQIDESSLTGEPLINKTCDPENFNQDATYPSNMVYKGTAVADGHGIMEVTLIGDLTELGKVARKATEVTNTKTPLNKQLDTLAKLIGVIGFALAILTFFALFLKDFFTDNVFYTREQTIFLCFVLIAGIVALTKLWLPIIYDIFLLFGKRKRIPYKIRKTSNWHFLVGGTLLFILLMFVGYFFGVDATDTDSWISLDTAEKILQYFMVAVTLIVVTVPEGLPMSVTLSLAMSMRQMLKTNNLVRKMHACETMGASTVICTDKTGTLTQNRMQVHEAYFPCLKDGIPDDSDTGLLVRESIAINSTAFLDFSDPTNIRPLGNPTEAALLLWLNSYNVNYLEIRESTKIIDQITFSTKRKFMATLVKTPVKGLKVLFMKGAPEIVLSKCDKVLTATGEDDVAKHTHSIHERLADYQAHAMRTLGFAYKILEPGDKTNIRTLSEGGLTYIGIAAISDPVRVDVPEAVAMCQDAGIRVKIVTGDTPGTAREIGKQIGIWKDGDSEDNIITGVDFENLSDTEARHIVKDLKIMCRARPTDKQRLVQLLQSRGEIVAVTGDGTNDAPALNYADVGLSMGTGTAVAKEASDITLLDDSFKSIVTAVLWGRSLYKNIQKFLVFQLTINITAMAVVFLGSLFGKELPLTVTQMLWVNLIMDTFAALALASLPPQQKVMKEKPRSTKDFILTSAMGKTILFTGITFMVILIGTLILFSNTELLNSLFGHILNNPDYVAKYSDGSDNLLQKYSLSVFFSGFVMLQFWNLFNAKAFESGQSTFKNIAKSPAFLFVALLILIGQILIVTFGGEVFRVVPITFKDWCLIIAVTSPVLIIGEIIRLIKK